MNERDELARILNGRGAYCGSCDYEEGNCSDCDNVLADYADAVLAAGYRKPRTITTAEELDALPDMTILVDQHGIAWQKFVDECSDQPYWAMDGTKCYQSGTVLNTYRRELTVLWEPK